MLGITKRMRSLSWTFVVFSLILGLGLASPRAFGQVVGGKPYYEFKVPLRASDTISTRFGSAGISDISMGGFGLNNKGQIAVPVQFFIGTNYLPDVLVEGPDDQILRSTFPFDCNLTGLENPCSQGVLNHSASYNDAGDLVVHRYPWGGQHFWSSIWYKGHGDPVEFLYAGAPDAFGGIYSYRFLDLSEDGYVAFDALGWNPLSGSGANYSTNTLMLSGPHPPSSPYLRPCESVLNLASGVEADVRSFYPVVARHGITAVKSGPTPEDGAIVRVTAAGTSQTLASAPSEFEWLGPRVAMDENGKAVAFIGRRNDGVEGIFLSLTESSFDHPTPIPVLDTSFIFALGENGEPIRFTAFATNVTLRMILHDRHADDALVDDELEGDSVLIAFMATPNRASITSPETGLPMFFSNQPGIWVARFDLVRGMIAESQKYVNFRTLTPVIQLGDLIGGAGIHDLQLMEMGRATRDANGGLRQTSSGHPEMGDHVIAFRAESLGGTYAVKAYHLDTDGDGLPDHWERAGGGLDMAGDGVVDLDLAALGADPLTKDIFLEMDWTSPRLDTFYPGGWKNEPTVDELRYLVEEQFRQAPLDNPSGITGINLHIDAGPGFSQNLPFGVDSSLLHGGQVITLQDGTRPGILYMSGEDHILESETVGSVRSLSMNKIKERFFMNRQKGARELAFRYAALGDFHRAVPIADYPYFFVESSARRRITASLPGGGSFSVEEDLPVGIYSLLFMDGRAAGHVRRGRMHAVGDEPRTFEFVLEPGPGEVPLSVRPRQGDRFVLCHTSGGNSEVHFLTNTFGNAHRLPGNDLLVTLGGWGVRPDFGLGDATKVWRVLSHELGHTMGLTHGGHSLDCAYKGDTHLSRMSYSHSLRSMRTSNMSIHHSGCSSDLDVITGMTSAPRLYSDGSDTEGLNEYAYLRMAPWNTPWSVGNSTFSRDAGATTAHGPDDPALEPPPLDGDRQGPRIFMPAPSARQVALVAPMAVTVTVTDVSGVAQVYARFDVNGDGAVTGADDKSVGDALGTNTYVLAFTNVTGSASNRILTVTALDALGNGTSLRASYRVGGSVQADTSAPWIYQIDASPLFTDGSSPVDVRMSVYEETVTPDGGVAMVEFSCDLNGDGVTNQVDEVLVGGQDVSGNHRVRLYPFSGPTGDRPVRVVAEDAAGNRRTNTIMVVRMIPADTTNPVIVAISPTNNAIIPLGSTTRVPVTVTVRDEARLSSISLAFDADGNGVATGYNETASVNFTYGETSATSTVYLPVSGGVIGGESTRVIDVTVEDFDGKQTTQRVFVLARDTQDPTISLSGPVIDQIITTGTSFTVTGSALDDQRVTNLVVRVDLDGDGLFTGSGEVVNVDPLSAASFSINFAGFTGGFGERRVRVEAEDPLGKKTITEVVVHFAPGLRVISPLPGDRLSIGSSVLVAVETPDATNLVIALDVNGDGDRIDPGETVTGAVRSANVQYTVAIKKTEAILGTLEGPEGLRNVYITGFRAGGQPLSLQVPLLITNDALFSSTRSHRVGGIPVHADPHDNNANVWTTLSHAPRLFHPYGTNLLFMATTETEGETLWISDGTPRGTRMIKDSNPDRDTSNALGVQWPVGMGVNGFVEFQDRVFFNATDEEGNTVTGTTSGRGNELWVTDGTRDGTYMFKDINTNVYPASYSSNPKSFVVYSNKLFFSAIHRGYDEELWVSDGTEEGTVQLADLEPGIFGSAPGQFVKMGGHLWFVALANDLWRTDGTSSGTVRVVDNSVEEFPYFTVLNLTAVGNRLFYVFGTPATGAELWTSDGTATGSVLVVDILPGSTSSNPKQFIAFSNRLWFVATTPALGAELWVSDGTSNGTKLVRDIWPGTSSSRPNNFTVHGGRLWFNAWDATNGDELWSTDGHDDGLRHEAEIGRWSGPSATIANANTPTANPTNLLSFANALYLQANDGGARYGAELWRIDSNAAPKLLRDIRPMIVHRWLPSPLNYYYNGPDSGSPANLMTAGNQLFFRGEDTLYRNGRLFVSDGSGSGTRRLGGRVRNWLLPASVAWGGQPLFAATSGKGGCWMRLNGNQLESFSLPMPDGVGAPDKVTVSANGIAFVANMRHATEFAGVGLFVAPSPGAAPVQLMLLNECYSLFSAGPGWLFAGRDTNNVPGLWCTGGTTASTHFVSTINTSSGFGYPRGEVSLGGETLFTMSVTQLSEVWVSDGSVAGTRRLVKSGTTHGLYVGQYFSVNGSRIGFFARDTSGTNRFWVMPDIHTNAEPGPELTIYSGSETPPAILNDRWVFCGSSPYTNLPLWITDGTITGTVGFGFATSATFPYTSLVGNARRLSVIGSRIYFGADFYFNGEEPFVSDGTPGGTYSLGNLYRNPGAGANPGSTPRQFTPLGSWVLFSATDSTHGDELWRTDGTEEGTVFLKDIYPGQPSSEISDMTNIGNRIYFTARDPDHGRELWSTDGTSQGTLLVEDLVPGPGSSDPKSLMTQSSNLYYFALDGSEDHSLRMVDRALNPLSPYEQWLAGFSLPGGFPGEPWQDGDGDAWNNELEYLFRTSPVDPSQRHPLQGVGVQVVYYPETATDYFVIHYQRPVNWQALGLWFQFESAYNLPHFSPVTAEQLSVQNQGDVERVSVRIYTKDLCCPSSPRPDYFFVRLKINRD